MSASEERLIPLPHLGLTCPVEPYRLLQQFEQRGIRLSLDGEGIIVRPAGALTEAERAALRRWRAHVRVLLTPPSPSEVQ